jgi:hypothetical protein
MRVCIKRATSSFRPVLQALLIFVAANAAGVRAQNPSARPAVPVDPIVAIVDAFRSHSLVGLGEPHRNEQAHRLSAQTKAATEDGIESAPSDNIAPTISNYREELARTLQSLGALRNRLFRTSITRPASRAFFVFPSRSSRALMR